MPCPACQAPAQRPPSFFWSVLEPGDRQHVPTQCVQAARGQTPAGLQLLLQQLLGCGGGTLSWPEVGSRHHHSAQTVGSSQLNKPAVQTGVPYLLCKFNTLITHKRASRWEDDKRWRSLIPLQDGSRLVNGFIARSSCTRRCSTWTWIWTTSSSPELLTEELLVRILLLAARLVSHCYCCSPLPQRGQVCGFSTHQGHKTEHRHLQLRREAHPERRLGQGLHQGTRVV